VGGAIVVVVVEDWDELENRIEVELETSDGDDEVEEVELAEANSVDESAVIVAGSTYRGMPSCVKVPFPN
jgi:hypothetical protein